MTTTQGKLPNRRGAYVLLGYFLSTLHCSRPSAQHTFGAVPGAVWWNPMQFGAWWQKAKLMCTKSLLHCIQPLPDKGFGRKRRRKGRKRRSNGSNGSNGSNSRNDSINHCQSAFKFQKEILYILAEMLKISKSWCRGSLVAHYHCRS